MAHRIPFTPAWDPEAEPASYLISTDQVQHMEDYMSDQSTADECAFRLTRVMHGMGAAAMSDAVYAINTFINHSAVTNLPYQPQMLSLIKAIQRLPPLEVPEPRKDEDGGDISLGDVGQRLWADMPGLGHAWGDDLLAYQADLYDNYTSARGKEAASTWANAQAWSAQLVSLHDSRITSEYFVHFMSYAIVHVLERQSHPLFVDELPAAVLAFKFGAPELLRLSRMRCQPEPRCALSAEFDDVAGLRGSERKSLWPGSGGYSPERWAFWKERWQAREEADAAVAVEAMNAAERQ